MALARCQRCGNPQGLKHSYPHVHSLAHFQLNGILCGSQTCIHPALIWLTDEEERQYLSGERSFQVLNRRIEVHVI
jgi:hypothetical protein